MSQEMIAALITSGCIAAMVLWIPAIYLVRHCIKAIATKVSDGNPVKQAGEMERVSAYLLSGSRHEQE